MPISLIDSNHERIRIRRPYQETRYLFVSVLGYKDVVDTYQSHQEGQ